MSILQGCFEDEVSERVRKLFVNRQLSQYRVVVAVIIILHIWGRGPGQGTCETACTALATETGPSAASLEMPVVAVPVPSTWTGMKGAIGIPHLLEAHPVLAWRSIQGELGAPFFGAD